LSVANTETIDLDVKLGLATEEISQNVLDFLMDHVSGWDFIPGVYYASGPARRALGVSDVAVSRQMKTWHAVHTLEIVYRDAFNNQLNDRYQAKFQEYQQLSRNAREHTLRYGIGLVLHPMPEADPPVFSSVAGTLADATYYVQVALVSAAGAEGSPSEATTYEGSGGLIPVVEAVNPPATATGFNVYMGTSMDTVMLQNSTPVAVGQSFTLPESGIVTGRAAGSGQTADLFVTGASMFRRG
ncbi:MAG: hypothetical protein ACRD5L_08730, partial [Bryobacteraceae bacterium]